MDGGKLMRAVTWVAGAGLGLVPGITSACAVCFGDPESAMTHGANLAILTLMGVTGGVLGGIVAFALRMRKRSKLLERHKGNGQAIRQKGGRH